MNPEEGCRQEKSITRFNKSWDCKKRVVTSVLYCTVLHCTVLDLDVLCTELYCALYCTVLYCVLYRVSLNYNNTSPQQSVWFAECYFRVGGRELILIMVSFYLIVTLLHFFFFLSIIIISIFISISICLLLFRNVFKLITIKNSQY